MAELMANADTALGAFLGASESNGDNGQAQAPESSKPSGSASEAQGKPGTETAKATTAKPEAPASATGTEQADYGEEYKPFESVLKAKKWDPKAKDFGSTVLKSFSELEKAHGQAGTDKAMLNTRQTDFQRRLSGTAKDINEFRKANGLPEIAVGKSYSEQVTERSEYLSHFNNMLVGKDPAVVAASEAWLNKQLVEGIQELRIKAGIESAQGGKTNEEHVKAFNEKAFNNYREIAPKGSEMEATFDRYVMPLIQPNGVLGSLGLTEAQLMQSPAHAKAFADIGKALQLAENYGKALADGVAKGVDEAMAQKRKAGNASGVGSQGKQTSGDTSASDFSRSLWAAKHN